MKIKLVFHKNQIKNVYYLNKQILANNLFKKNQYIYFINEKI